MGAAQQLIKLILHRRREFIDILRIYDSELCQVLECGSECGNCIKLLLVVLDEVVISRHCIKQHIILAERLAHLLNELPEILPKHAYRARQAACRSYCRFKRPGHHRNGIFCLLARELFLLEQMGKIFAQMAYRRLRLFFDEILNLGRDFAEFPHAVD